MNFLNFSFELFGFDFMGLERNYGFWLGMFKLDEYGEDSRSLLALYNADGEWYFQFMYFNVFGDF